MSPKLQIAAVAMLVAGLVATSRGSPGTFSASDEARTRLDDEIVAMKAKLADLEHQRALLAPANGSPNTHVVVGYFRETTTIKFVDRTKSRAVVVSSPDRDGNLHDLAWILAADAFVFIEGSDAERRDWNAIKPGTRLHLYCPADKDGGYGPPVRKVGIPTAQKRSVGITSSRAPTAIPR